MTQPPSSTGETPDDAPPSRQGGASPQRQARRHQPPPLVRPSVYQYSCRGALYLNDADAHAAVGGGSGGSGGGGGVKNDPSSSSLPSPQAIRGTPRCVGIESRLRKLQDLPPSSRDAALKDFIDMTSVEPAGASSGSGGDSGSNHRPGDKGGVSATAPGSGRGPLGPAPALPVLPGAADYGPPTDEEPLPAPPSRRRTSGGVQILPPANAGESGGGGDNNDDWQEKNGHNHDDDTWSTLSCYGNTQISVLMLKGSDGKSEVAAVAPENTLGVTVRDEGDSTGGDAVATLRIGPVEIAVGNHYEFQDDVEEQEQDRSERLRDDDEEEEKDAGFGDFGRELGGWGRPPTAIGGDDRRRRRKEEGDGDADPSAAAAEEDDRRPALESSSDRHRRRRRPDEARNARRAPPEAEGQSDESSFPERFAKTLTKTAESMKSNASMVAGEMNDDMFPNRIYRSGERIVGQFGKTLERTGRVAKDIYKMWSNDDDDEED